MRSGDTAAGTFDAHLEAWRAWQESPWGRLRYRVVRETLARTCDALGTGPLRVLDVGGGDGGDAIPLAQLGHDVTLVDYSEPLLARAAAAAAELGVERHLRTVCADLDELPSAGLGAHDLVLCHNVLQYRADVASTVALLAPSVTGAGAISLIAPNPASDVLAAAIRREALPEALDLLDAGTVRTLTFDHDARRIEPEEAEAALWAAGFDLFARFGIRCVTDFIANDARKHEPDFYEDLQRLELALCDREPFVRTARMWQLVGRRNEGRPRVTGRRVLRGG